MIIFMHVKSGDNLSKSIEKNLIIKKITFIILILISVTLIGCGDNHDSNAFLKEQIVELESSVANLESKLSDLEDEQEKTQSDLSDLEGRVSDIESRLNI